MSSKRPLSTSPNSYDQWENLLAKFDICKVCGDRAHINNYGALSCSPCKAFFRRHGFHPENAPLCLFNKNCSITIATRKTCPACRFAKCLKIGMSSELIRKEDFNGKKSSKYALVSKTSPSVLQISTLDLLYTDRSCLTSFDWKILSNVTHAFDKYSPISNTCQVIEQLSLWPSNLSFDISPVLDLFTKFYTSTESFISSTPDFQILSLTEKTSLYQRNLHGVLNFCATFILTMAGMFNISNNEHILTSIYCYDIYQQTKYLSMKLEHDPTIIKLMLIILAFSSNCYMIDEDKNMNNDSLLYGTFRLFGSQNMYIEILWKYMIYRYGYYQASIRFVILVKIVLDLLKMSGTAHQNNELHQNFVEETAGLVEQLVIENANEVTILWGKTEI